MFQSSTSKVSSHADSEFNVYKAETFIEDKVGKMPNGVKVELRRGGTMIPPILFISAATNTGNYAAVINLNQSYEAASKEIQNSYASVCKIAQEIIHA